VGIYARWKERVSGVAEKGRSRFFGNPCGKRISINEFPIYELAFWCFADDCTAGWIPILDDLQNILNLSWERP
jgi:hypothetical protein